MYMVYHTMKATQATQATLVPLQWSPIMGKQGKQRQQRQQCKRRTELRASSNNESLLSCSLNNECRNTEPLFNEQLNIETLASSSTVSSTDSCTASSSTESARDYSTFDVRSDVMIHYIPSLTKADELLTRYDDIFNGTQYVEMHDDDENVIIDVEGDSSDDLSNDVRNEIMIPDDDGIEEHVRDINDDVFKIELIESIDEIVIDDCDAITQLFHDCFPIVVDIL